MSPLNRSENNFDIMRLIAAWMVLFSHSFVLYDRSVDPFGTWFGYVDAAKIALNIFFVLSGYLIAASFLSNPKLVPYFTKRILRIFPALIVVIVLAALVMGPFVTTLGIEDYYNKKEVYKYIRGALIFPLKYELPGVFSDLPYPNAVNGSLWSLKVELRCYIMIALFGVLSLLRPKFIGVFALASLVLFAVLTIYADSFDKRVFGLKYTFLLSNSEWFFAFFSGAFFYLIKDKICYTKRIFILVLITSLIGWYAIVHGYLIHMLCLPYMVLYIGLKTKPIGHLLRGNDISYGMYIYAFPLQQLYMHVIGNSWGFVSFVVVVTVSTIICAILSWAFIEKPCLRLKPKKKASSAPTSP